MGQDSLNVAAAGYEQPENKLSELIHIIAEHDDDSILLNTFSNSVDAVFDIAADRQTLLLTIHLKNKLKGRASQLKNLRDLRNWDSIKAF